MANKRLSDLSVKARLIGFMAFMLLLLILTGAGGLFTLRSYNISLTSIYNYQVLPLKELREIENLFNVDLAHVFNDVLYKDNVNWDESLEHLQTTRNKIHDKWTALFKSQDSSDSSHWLQPGEELLARCKASTELLVNSIKARNLEEIDDFHDLKFGVLSKDYKDTIDKLIQNRLSSILSEFDDMRYRYAMSQLAFLISLLIGALVSFIAGFLLLRDINLNFDKIKNALRTVNQGDLTNRMERKSKNNEFGVLIDGFNQMSDYICDLVKKIQQSGIQVTSSITEIAATIRQQETTSNEHAATISEIAASTTEIAATSSNLMNTMTKVNSLTKNTAFAAGEGHAGLKNIDQTMVKMENATGSIVEKLSILSEKAGNIAGVVKTINKIADQTNLLSLNAAIEAEKAGEYGAGFAVVATEIRRLADQTAMATLDIEQMVQEVQSAVSAGVMGIDKFAVDVRSSVKDIRDSGEQLSGVIEQVQVLMPQINTVNDGIEAQAQGADQISSATSQLNEAAQQTAESIAQTSITITQLQEATENLREAISLFKVN